MQTPYEFDKLDARMVYVRPIDVRDLPEHVQAEAGDLETLFSVHNAQGEQLALVADRRLAFALARQNDFSPQPLH